MPLTFLPEKLNLDGPFDELVDNLYKVFEDAFFAKGIRYENLPVVCDNRRVDTSYPEGFWHLISRGDKNSGMRLLDFKRAKRLVWLKPLIEHSDDPQLCKWIEDGPDRKGSPVCKTYILYPEGKYLVVMKKIPRKYFLLTAFYITGPRRLQKYLDRFDSAKKGARMLTGPSPPSTFGG